MEPSAVAAAGTDTEIGHTLFVDIVQFSTRPMEEQSLISDALRTHVLETPAYLRAQNAGDVLSLPTGDGMALVFFRNPLAPVQCATELGRALHSATFGVRMGIHSGPVARIRDINNQTNATGSGINTAQRVMDCGEAGHILMSGSTAEVVREFATWASCLQPLGAVEVKHGVSVQLYNLVSPEVGNPSVPLRVQQGTQPVSSSDPSFFAEPSISGAGENRVPLPPPLPPLVPAANVSGANKSRPLHWAVIVLAIVGVLSLLSLLQLGRYNSVVNINGRKIQAR